MNAMMMIMWMLLAQMLTMCIIKVYRVSLEGRELTWRLENGQVNVTKLLARDDRDNGGNALLLSLVKVVMNGLLKR